MNDTNKKNEKKEQVHYVGTLTPSYADVVRSTDGGLVSQSKPMTRMSRMSNVDEEEQH